MSLNFFDTELAYLEDKNLQRDDVKTLTKWVHSQPHLPTINEAQAILFLRRWNYHIDSAQNAVDSYFTFKTFCSDLYLGRSPLKSPLKAGLDLFCMSVLPKKTPEGCFIFFIKMVEYNLEKFDFATQLKYFDVVLMLHLYLHGSTDYVVVLDVKEWTRRLLDLYDILMIKKCFYYMQKLIPLKLKRIHYFNFTRAIDDFLSMVKPYAQKELGSSLYFHETVNDLLKYIPRDCLPRDYGGSVESVSILHGKVKNTLFANSALFEWEDRQTVDERKRPEKSKVFEDIKLVLGSSENGLASGFASVEFEYIKDKNLKRTEVREIVDWVHNQPHLPNITELQALLFLQRWQYQKDLIKNAIDTYFTFKTLYSDLLLKRNPFYSPVKEAVDAANAVVLPKKTPEGNSVFYLRLLDLEIENFDFVTQLRHIDMALMLNQHQEGYSKGYSCVVDLEDIPYEFIATHDPIVVKKFFYYIQKVAPLNIKEIHFINNSFINEYLTVIKPFINKELLEVYCHVKVDSLFEYIPRKCLPKDCGGHLEPISVLQERNKAKLLANAAFFDWEDSQTVHEEKRPKESKTLQNILADFSSIQKGLTPLFFDVENEYVKDQNLKKEDVEEIIEWVHSQPHLPKINENQAIFFLQRWQYQTEIAKNALDSYFTYKTFCADLFLGRNPLVSPLKEAIDVCFFMVLPQKTHENYGIIFGKVLDQNLDHFDYSDQFKHVDMVIALSLYQEGNFDGYRLVMDVGNLPVEMMHKLVPFSIKRSFHYVQDVSPLRVKGFHYFNTNSFMEDLMQLLKANLKEEYAEMLYAHRDVDSLAKFVPKECLPKDYGGSLDSCVVLQDITKTKLLANAALFEWEDSQIVDENLRPLKYKPVKDILAIFASPQNDLLHFSKFKSEYDRDANLKKEDVREVIQWVNSQPHLPAINEIQAIRFLQRWHHEVEVAKSAIDSYFTYKTFSSDLFFGRNPSELPLRTSLDFLLVTPLPKKTPQGYTILFAKIVGSMDKLDYVRNIKHADIVHTLELYREGSDGNFVLLADLGGTGPEVLTKVGFFEMKRYFHYVEEVAPFQWKGFHLFNLVPFMNEFLNHVKPALPIKLSEKLYIHETFDDLVKYIPKECLPRDYGGSAESVVVLQEKIKHNLLASTGVFEFEDKQKVKEEKRPDRYKAMKDIFAIVHPLQNGGFEAQNGTLPGNGSWSYD